MLSSNNTILTSLTGDTVEEEAEKNARTAGWRDGSVVVSTHCSPRGPVFCSQHLHGRSQFPGDLMMSSGLHGHCTQVVHKHRQAKFSY